MIAWLDAHAYMVSGKIQRFDLSIAGKMEGVKVAQGGVTTQSKVTQTEPEAPSDKKGEPHKARIGK
jgi:hypothetical protein